MSAYCNPKASLRIFLLITALLLLFYLPINPSLLWMIMSTSFLFLAMNSNNLNPKFSLIILCSNYILDYIGQLSAETNIVIFLAYMRIYSKCSLKARISCYKLVKIEETKLLN